MPEHESQKRGLHPLALAVLALWAGLVVFAFFREHPLKINYVLRLIRNYQPPPVPSDFLKILAAAKHILLACILTLAGILAGRRILSMLGIGHAEKSPRESSADRWETIAALTLALGLGWGVLIYAVFLLGAVGGLYTAAIWGLIALSFLCGRGEISPLFKDLAIAIGRGESTTNKSVTTPFHRLAAAAVCGMLLLIAIIALAPSITHDAMVYHLNVPRQYILEHAIVPIAYNLFANTFLNIEMLYTSALLLDDFMLANLLHYILGIAVLALLYSFARANFGRAVAALATLMFFFNPVVLSQMQFAYVDVGITFYFLLAFFCLWKWKCEGDRRWFFLMCVFAGIFAATKYTSIYGLATLGLATGAVSLGIASDSGTSGRRMWGAARDMAQFGLIITLFVLPYLIKNYVISGNPVYPVAFNIFGGEWLVPAQVERMLGYVDSHGMGRDWRHMLALPWNITIHGKVGFDNFDATITPLWLALLPALLLTRPNPPLVRWATAISAVYFLSWASYTHITRYTMPIFPLLSLVCAYAVVRLIDRAASHSAGLSKAVKVGAVFLCGIVWFSFSYFFPLRVPAEFGPAVWGEQTRDEFLGKKVISYEVFKYINEELPGDARLVFFWDNRGYFCDRPKIGDSVIEAPTMIELLHDSGSARAFYKKLVSDGYTHVMFNRLFFAKFPTHTTSEEDRLKFDADMKVFEKFLKRFCEPLFEADMAEVYALKK
jgi:hypothetical protein